MHSQAYSLSTYRYSGTVPQCYILRFSFYLWWGIFCDKQTRGSNLQRKKGRYNRGGTEKTVWHCMQILLVGAHLTGVTIYNICKLNVKYIITPIYVEYLSHKVRFCVW